MFTFQPFSHGFNLATSPLIYGIQLHGMADKSSASHDYITFLSRGPEKGLSLDVTDLMITTEPVAANILDVRKAVW